MSIFIIVIYALINISERSKSKDVERQNMIKNSTTCKNLIFNYEISVKKGKPILTKEQLEKKISEILKDKDEKIVIAENICSKEKRALEIEQNKRNKRKIGYKYQDYIFYIFDDNRELSRVELLDGIAEQLKITSIGEDIKILEIWQFNNLINKCHWNENKYEIGDVLTDDYYKIDVEDITWKDWLKNKNIQLKPQSPEYIKFIS
ncbi:hypothetical protein [Flavobacterium sp. GP15]|uniref:hypothetical protein n=1 Tax=Flavobacterium sp. GP15 TaxID=2758567 RepID=UPI00165E3909|nr:hypothetical protein [Flavobacterium sp. GP15]